MSLLKRLKKLESNNPNKPPCFCGKTLLNFWYGGADAEALTYCAHCKDQYDWWVQVSAEAQELPNLTDEKSK